LHTEFDRHSRRSACSPVSVLYFDTFRFGLRSIALTLGCFICTVFVSSRSARGTADGGVVTGRLLPGDVLVVAVLLRNHYVVGEVDLDGPLDEV
jgi:hypothetical protein